MNKGMVIGLVILLIIGGGLIGIRLNKPVQVPMDDTPMVNDMETDGMKDDMETDGMEDDMESDGMEDDMESDGMKDDMESDGMKDDKDVMMNDGPKAPAFSLLSVNGEKISLEDFNKEKVMVKFWASWCSICLAGLDEIDQLSGEMNDFEVLTIVSPGHNGEKNTEDFLKWFETRGTENLVVLLDEGGEIAKSYGVRGYPTTAFIGSDGVLVKQFPGHIDNANIASLFETIK